MKKPKTVVIRLPYQTAIDFKTKLIFEKEFTNDDPWWGEEVLQILRTAIIKATPPLLEPPTTIQINTEKYTLSEVEKRRVKAIRAFHLVKAVKDKNSNPKGYYVSLTSLGFVTCTCEDYVFTKSGTRLLCKHGNRLRELKLL